MQLNTTPSHLNVSLSLPASAARRWLIALRERLAEHGHDVSLIKRGSSPNDDEIARIARVDRIVNGSRGSSLAEPLPVASLSLDHPADREEADATLIRLEPKDSDGAASPLELELRFDGETGEAPLFSALLAHRSPLIELRDRATGNTVAHGVASLELANSVMSAADAVFARTITLIEAVIRRGGNGPRIDGLPPLPVHPTSLQSGSTKKLALALPRKLIRTAYEALFYFPHWRVGWRETGKDSVWRNGSLDGSPWHVIPDPRDHFYADPFPVAWQGRRMIFFEDLDHRTGKGIIAAVEADAASATGPAIPILEEPWHLSYPFLMEHAGALWMIPESSANRTVDLYRCTRFPDRWEKHATLLSGIEAADATIIHHGGRFWMFATVRDGAGAYSDTLHLFHSEKLDRDWRPHPANPVLIDARAARPAGAMHIQDGKLWRPAQVCDRFYGAGLALAEVTQLDEQGFAQTVRHVLTPGPAWPGRRLHTLNEAAGIACIDGSAWSLRSPLLAHVFEPWCLRRSALKSAARREPAS